MAFYYEPTAGGAYESLQRIDRLIPHGASIRSIHDIAGNGLIVTALFQLVILFLGRQFRTNWLIAWMSGILFTLTAIALSWTAIILDWSQLGFWRMRIELETIATIPAIGATLQNILTGGSGINSITVIHLYTIHGYFLSIIALILSVIHLGGLIRQEMQLKGAIAEQSQESQLVS
ncbi:MAG: cytochrome bc complex cytochrome b subunit [Cyanobacteria bacterium SBLK]|nr:cytochrome bc complex cytochrome b subunit [Cyanobacteria bacterium SBLK]